MVSHAFEFLDIVMVVSLIYRLRCCWSCRVFWLIQAFQLYELFDLYGHGLSFTRWFNYDYLNLPLELIAIFVAFRHFRFAAYVFALHFYVKANQWQDFTFPDDVSLDFWMGLRFWLNNLCILALLMYPLRKAILRQWRVYVSSPA